MSVPARELSAHRQAGDVAAAGTVVPLSALRGVSGGDTKLSRWATNVDGVPGRSLVMTAGMWVRFALALGGEVTVRGRARLLPHDWRDGRGAVRASVHVTAVDGTRREAWAAVLRAGDRGHPRGAPFAVAVDRSTTAVELRLDQLGELVVGTATRAIWVEPALVDPSAQIDAIAPRPRTSLASAPPPAGPPLVSVLLPVHDPPPHMLDEAVASVRAQTFTDWELCLVDDGSQNPEIIAALQHHAASDPRIHLARHETARGISAATNTATEIATGRYIALLDHDDTLTPDALQHVAAQIASDPSLDMLYSDEDTVDDAGRRIGIHLKPAWSLDTLRTNGYTCHLGVYRRELVQRIGGFRTEFNGSQDVDMILRLTERTDRVAHIPRVLYHWRAHTASTAAGYEAKPYAYVAARNAIADHLRRAGLEAEVTFGPPGLYRVTHAVRPEATVDLVLAVTDTDGLAEAAAGWRRQPHPAWHVLLAMPSDLTSEAMAVLSAAGIPERQITIVAADQAGDPVAALAAAAAAGSAEHLVLMQTPAVGVTHDWLTRLIGYGGQPGIVAAGPVLLGPGGDIEQAGVALPGGTALHLLHGTRSSIDHHFGYGTSVYNVSAVSGVVATTRRQFAVVDGLRPEYRELGLIEYCLRAAADGGRTVVVPDARLRRTGPDPAVNDLPALAALRREWARTRTVDPYYNPNFRTDRGDFAPALR
jgi:O-antigen biosynthesis protein